MHRPSNWWRRLACVATITTLLTSSRADARDDADVGDPPSDPAVDAALAREGCTPHAVLSHGDSVYAACGPDGVLVFTKTADGLTLRERRVGGGEARDVFLRSERVWIELQRTEAVPLASLPTGTTASTERAPLALTPSAPTAPAAPTAPRRESRIAPPRVGGVLRLEGALRPFLPVENLGIAAIANLAVTYHGQRHWYVRAEVMPLGGLAADGPDNWVFGATASGGYDHPLFAIGLGIGTLRIQHSDYYYDPITGMGQSIATEGMKLAISQSFRLGALDGLHGRFDTSLVLENERWGLGFMTFAIQVPAGDGTWVIAEGSGGDRSNFFYLEAGMRRLLRETRGAGAIFVSAGAGVGGMRTEESAFSTDDFNLGPMLSIRGEWRM